MKTPTKRDLTRLFASAVMLGLTGAATIGAATMAVTGDYTLLTTAIHDRPKQACLNGRLAGRPVTGSIRCDRL